jgi:predicted NBD/HSP70 family sugar kinase
MLCVEWERQLRFKADSEQIRRQNRSLVLETLRRQGQLARVELGRATGLSPATITSISSDLIDEGLVRSAGEGAQDSQKPGPGRPLVRLERNPDAARILAIKISIDEIDFAIADFSGNLVSRSVIHVPTFEANAQEFGRLLVEQAKVFLGVAATDPVQLRHIGVAVQGFADANQGTIVWSPAFRARNIPVAAPLALEFGVSCSVSNDANMIAESLLGGELSRFSGTAAVIYVGPGIGMGLIIKGAIYSGWSGAAAEFGHMNHMPHGPLCRCGQHGCIEAYAASYGIFRNARGDTSAEAPHTAVPESEMITLEEEAKAGVPKAVNAFREAGLALGFGISRLAALLSPEKVYFAGPGTRAYPLMEAAIREGFEEGLVADLRQGLTFEVAEWNRDMITAGIVSGGLRFLDREVFSRPGHSHIMQAAQ